MTNKIVSSHFEIFSRLSQGDEIFFS